MTGDEFLKLAGKLFAPYVSGGKPADEALFRAIVGRAYYGSFHLAKEFLEGLGVPTGKHGALPDYLRASNEPSAKRASEMLATLYQFRSDADYKLTDSRAIRDFNNFRFVNDQINRADKVKSLLRECNAEPAKSRIRAGIEAHLQSKR